MSGAGREIISTLMGMARRDSHAVSAILIAILEHVAKDRDARKQ